MVTLVFSRAVQKFLLTYLLTYLHLADFSAAEICQLLTYTWQTSVLQRYVNRNTVIPASSLEFS